MPLPIALNACLAIWEHTPVPVLRRARVALLGRTQLLLERRRARPARLAPTPPLLGQVRASTARPALYQRPSHLRLALLA